MSKITPEIELIIKELAFKGEGIKSISKTINIPRTTVKIYIVKNNIQLQDARHNKAPIKITLEIESKIRAMALNGMIATQIAKELDLHKETIRIFAKNKGIELRLGNKDTQFVTKITPEIEIQIKELIIKGLNATDIAKKIGTITRSTVQNYAKTNKLKIAIGKEKDLEYINAQNKFEKLLKSGINFTEARKEAGLAYNNAQKIAKKRGLEEFIRDREKASTEDKALSFEYIKEQVELIGYKLISTEYQNNKGPITVQCPNGHPEWSTIWNSIDQGQRCPKCSANYSKPQEEMTNFVKSIYNGTVIENDWNVLGTRELDIWLPELNIGIEHDGLRAHSDVFDYNDTKRKKTKRMSHIEKMRLIKNSGITFLAFYGDEWQNPKTRLIVESIIKNKIGITSNKIYARKTKFVEITNKEAKEFLDANHLDGYVNCSKSFGLKYNGQLVMVMNLRVSSGKIWEIARMATLINHTVIGGASKMLKQMPRPLMSYSDNRISNGNVYKSLGFEEITKTLEPSYFYTDFKIRVFRTSCKKIKNIEGEEKDQALAGHFSKHFGHSKPVYRIYDYGQRKWLLK